MIGSVKSYDSRRGVGVIASETGGVDVPVHASEVERAGFAGLEIGERLRFSVMTDRALGRSFAVKLSRL